MASDPDIERTQPAPMRGRDVALWIGILAGPIAWAIDLELSYALVPPAQASGHKLGLHLATLAAAVIAAASALIAWRVLGQIRRESESRRVEPSARERFMAVSGIGLSLFFLLAILAMGVGKFVHGLGD